MEFYYEPGENDRITTARESFSGRLMNERQFEEALALTHIIEREIHRSGSFKDKLGDYAYAFARSERFDAVKAENMLRDIFKERTGQTMNHMREGLMDVEAKLTEEQKQIGTQYAYDIAEIMQNGAKFSFNRAVAHQSQQMASELGITDKGARQIMADQFEAVEKKTLWDWGKELDETYYRPQIEAEKSERARVKQAEQGMGQANTPQRKQTMSAGPRR